MLSASPPPDCSGAPAGYHRRALTGRGLRAMLVPASEAVARGGDAGGRGGTMRWKRGLGLGLIAAALAGCASGGASRPADERPPGSAPLSAPTAEGSRQPTERVIFALPSLAGSYAPHHIALQKGLFREEGQIGRASCRERV